MPSINYLASAKLPTKYGLFQAHIFADKKKSFEVLALSCGNLRDASTPIVRIHSECATGDIFGSERCDCGEQLRASMVKINKEGKGLLVYLPQEGRGIGLSNKIRAYALQEQGHDTVSANNSLGFDADLREYSCCKDVFDYFNISKLRLMTNNPSKIKALEDMGLIVERVSLQIKPNEHNVDYLHVKKERLNHLLDI